MKKIVLVFDIDDTLYRQMDPLVSACEACLGYQLQDREKFYSVFCKRSAEMFRASESGEISIKKSRLIRIQNTLQDLQIPCTEELAENFQKKYAQNQLRLSLAPELEELLEWCREENVPMGILTNGPLEHQMRKYRILGMNRWIPEKFTLVSAGAGVAKPDVRIFEMLQKQMNLKEYNFWMIGDSYANDICGAKKAGWNTIWINYHHYKTPEDGANIDYTACSEKELSEMVKKLLTLS
ncbi:MAG: HAD family hydrolase [Eubacteriales bacterium]|nr:HAD family hydrolase [Eubacteriales bacterium]